MVIMYVTKGPILRTEKKGLSKETYFHITSESWTVLPNQCVLLSLNKFAWEGGSCSLHWSTHWLLLGIKWINDYTEWLNDLFVIVWSLNIALFQSSVFGKSNIIVCILIGWRLNEGCNGNDTFLFSEFASATGVFGESKCIQLNKQLCSKQSLWEKR